MSGQPNKIMNKVWLRNKNLPSKSYPETIPQNHTPKIIPQHHTPKSYPEIIAGNHTPKSDMPKAIPQNVFFGSLILTPINAMPDFRLGCPVGRWCSTKTKPVFVFWTAGNVGLETLSTQHHTSCMAEMFLLKRHACNIVFLSSSIHPNKSDQRWRAKYGSATLNSPSAKLR